MGAGIFCHQDIGIGDRYLRATLAIDDTLAVTCGGAGPEEQIKAR